MRSVGLLLAVVVTWCVVGLVLYARAFIALLRNEPNDL
jgi:hypothetical protein